MSANTVSVVNGWTRSLQAVLKSCRCKRNDGLRGSRRFDGPTLKSRSTGRIIRLEAPMLQRTLGSLAIFFMVGIQGLASPQSSAPPSDEVYRSGNGVTTPTLLKRVGPQYTAEAMRAKIEGSVLM